MQELRKDRKIRMTISDVNVDEYIMLNIEDPPLENERTPFMRQVLQDKEDMRREMLVQISELQIQQVMLMLRTIHGTSATMMKGSAFALKVHVLLQ